MVSRRQAPGLEFRSLYTSIFLNFICLGGFGSFPNIPPNLQAPFDLAVNLLTASAYCVQRLQLYLSFQIKQCLLSVFFPHSRVICVKRCCNKNGRILVLLRNSLAPIESLKVFVFRLIRPSYSFLFVNKALKAAFFVPWKVQLSHSGEWHIEIGE